MEVERFDSEVVLQLLRHHWSGFAIDFGDHDSGTFLGKSTRNPLANAVAGAGDHGNSIEQSLVCHISPRGVS